MNRIPNLPAPAGVTVFLDETGPIPQLKIACPKGVKLPKVFISACHTFAGDNGATIEFVR